MTPTQLKTKSTKDLLIAYRHKVRCFHSRNIAKRIYKEIESRIGKEVLIPLQIEKVHLENNESNTFDDEINKLI